MINEDRVEQLVSAQMAEIRAAEALAALAKDATREDLEEMAARVVRKTGLAR